MVHGIPNVPVDIYVVKNFFAVRKLTNVNFGTAADLNSALPGFVTPGFYFVDIVPAGASPYHPLLKTFFTLGANQSKSVVAYVSADPAGKPGAPTLGVFANDVTSTNGGARVTTRHTAVAPPSASTPTAPSASRPHSPTDRPSAVWSPPRPTP